MCTTWKQSTRIYYYYYYRVVDAEPDVADDVTKGPMTEGEVEGKEGHGQGTNGEVSDAERHEEVIADRLQSLVCFKCDNNQQVGSCCKCRQGRCDNCEKRNQGNGRHVIDITRTAAAVVGNITTTFIAGIATGWIIITSNTGPIICGVVND